MSAQSPTKASHVFWLISPVELSMFPHSMVMAYLSFQALLDVRARSSSSMLMATSPSTPMQ